MRADALAKRGDLITAARALFSERGSAVSMRSVAEAAGVGIATLYRHFPQERDLILAVAEALAAQVITICDHALDLWSHDPAAAWRGFVHDLAALKVGALVARLSLDLGFDPRDPQISQVRQQALASIDLVLARAKAAGLAPPDLSALQFQFGIGVLTRPLSDAMEAMVPGHAEWLIEVYIAGLKPPV